MSNMKKKELEEKVEELASELFKAKNAIVALAERRENQLATIEDLALLVKQYEITINLLTGRLIEGSHPLYGVGK